MTAFVLDCSVAAAWAFEDEAGGYADTILDLLPENGCVVPQHWALEVSNTLVTAERRGRMTPGDAAHFVRLLSRLPIAVDHETSERALRDTRLLAEAAGLSAYDAAYLELAMRQGLPLASQDMALRSAATHLGVRVIE